MVAFQVTTNAFHPTYCKWRFGRIVKFSPVGIDGEPRSAEIMYLSFPGDPDSGKKGIERTMKRRLDTLIPVGDTNLHETFARDVEWTQRIINGQDNPEEQPQIPVQTQTTEIEQDTPNNKQQEEETQEPSPNEDKDYAEDDPSQEHPAGQTQEPVQLLHKK